MLSPLVVTLLLSQYVRAQVDRNDPASQCLWWKDGTVIAVQQSAAGNPETPGDTEFTAVSAAFATWTTQLEACSNVRFDEQARSPNRQVANDGVSLVLFRQVDCDDLRPSCSSPSSCGNERDCWEHANGALAITTNFYESRTGRMTDADIEFNTPGFIFTAVDSPPCVSPNFNVGCVASDVQNTVTHEVGHLLGLGHSLSPSSTMNATARPTELNKRVLDADSKKFICEVYRPGLEEQGCVVPAYRGTLGKSSCAAVSGLELSALCLLLARKRKR